MWPRCRPTPERSGDFSQTMAYDENGNLVQNQIFDPFTTDANGNRTAYTGNMIPQGEWDPVGQAILKLYPEAEPAGRCGHRHEQLPQCGAGGVQQPAVRHQGRPEFQLAFAAERAVQLPAQRRQHAGRLHRRHFQRRHQLHGRRFYNDGLEYTFSPTREYAVGEPLRDRPGLAAVVHAVAVCGIARLPFLPRRLERHPAGSGDSAQ